MNIYVASSWRNADQPTVVRYLRDSGHGVYDFRNPPGGSGFAWSEISMRYQHWTIEEYFDALHHPKADRGFTADFGAMQWADACVMLLPCGRSAHLEAGWMKGAGKKVFVLSLRPNNLIEDPELMVKMFDGFYTDVFELGNDIWRIEKDLK